MALRREHDATRPAVLPSDEQPFADAGLAAPLVQRTAEGRVAGSEAARRLAKMPRRDRFVPRRIACDPRFEVHNRRRLDWARKRRAELHAMTGGVSYAVGAMVASAAWLYAAGEFAAELAAASGDVDLFKSAATLTATARTHDMGAWELATREATARPKAPRDYAGELAAIGRGERAP
jgi:hypothetical protein